jgi:septal ring factor EnvC (AmiA/AmiB activator)
MPLVVLLIMWTAALISTAAQQPVATHQQELQRLRQSIDATRQRIRDLSRRESSAMRSLTASQRQQKNLQRLIAELSGRLSVLEDSLRFVEVQITQTRTSISRAEDRWKLLTRSMQEHVAGQRGLSRTSELASYLYAASTRSTVTLKKQLASVADSLSDRMMDLGYESQAQARSLRQQEQKRIVVAQALTQQKKEIQTVRANKQQLMEELRKKQQSAAKIRSLIEQLVARERSKRSSEKQRVKPGEPPTKRGRTSSRESTISSSAPQRGPFTTNSLPWPTPGRSVLHGYGTYTNPSTGTSHENPGIDIKASTGTSVACVAKGQVSTVTWLPGFGSLVIVDHLNGFRTVYANLASVSVQRGADVGQGSRIGASGSNLDGDVVHFEIWIDGKRINPLTYLR